MLRGVIRKWGIIPAVCSGRQEPTTVDSTRFARVMRELGIRQVYDLPLQAKRRADWMLGAFQDRLVIELHLAIASTIDEARLVLKVFLFRSPRGHRRLPGNVLDPGRFSSGGYGPAALVSRWSLRSSPSVGRPA